MSGSRFVVSVAFVIAVAGSAVVTAEQPEVVPGAPAPMAVSHGLPASLDSLYPPRSHEPKFLLQMLTLGSRLTGVAVDLATQSEVAEHDIVRSRQLSLVDGVAQVEVELAFGDFTAGKLRRIG